MSSSSNFNLAYNKQDVVAGGALSNATPTTTTGGGGGSGVTLINTAGSVNGITLTGGPITATGTISLGGTLGGIANSQLNNSSVTVTAGTGLSGGGAVSLGGTTTLTNSGVTSVAGAGTVSVSASTGNVTITGSGFSNPMTTLGDTIYGASTGTATRLAGNTATRRQYLSQTGTGSVSAPPAWVNGPSYNVLDYGIIADNSTDQTAKLNTMISSLPGDATVYFPAGLYVVNGPVSVTSGHTLTFKGDGPTGTVLTTTSSTSAIFDLENNIYAVQDLRLNATSRTVGFQCAYPLLKTISSNTLFLSNVYVTSSGDGISITSCNYILAVNVRVQAGSSGTCILIQGSGGQVSNCVFQNTNGRPSVILQGNFTSMYFSNNLVAGGGPMYNYTPSAISSDGTNITYTMSSTTGFAKNGFISVSGMTTTAYNGFFLITSVTSTTVIAKAFGTTAFYAAPSSGSGTVGSGQVTTVSACMAVTNQNGYCNESTISNCQFGANVYPSAPISAGLLIDGSYNSNSIEGWLINSNYYDYGKIGILLIGGGNPSNPDITTTARIGITGGTIVGNGGGYLALGGIWVISTPGVSISNIAPAGNAFSITPASSFYYVYNNNYMRSDGLKITGCASSREFWNADYPNYTYNAMYGLTVDGGPTSATLQAITVGLSTLWGQTHATQVLNSGVTSSTAVAGHGTNLLFYGTSNPPSIDTSAYF
jgi:hypothetical protein